MPTDAKQFKFVDDTPVSRRRQVSACYSCRFKKVKCSYEKPQCDRCVKSRVICQYPTSKRARRGTGSQSITDDDISFTAANTPDPLTEGNTDPTQTLKFPDTSAPSSSCPSSSSSVGPPATTPTYSGPDAGIEIDHSSDVPLFSPGHEEDLRPQPRRHHQEEITSLLSTSLDALLPGVFFDTSQGGMGSGTMYGKREAMPASIQPEAQECLFRRFDDYIDASPPTYVADARSGYVRTPHVGGATRPSSDHRGKRGSSTCPNNLPCHTVTLDLLEDVSTWRRFGSLLQTISAFRRAVRQLHDVSHCTRCCHVSSSMMLFVILAEKLTDKATYLRSSDMLLTCTPTSQANANPRLSFGEYQVETSEEQWTVYVGLLRANIIQFREVLSRLAHVAEKENWDCHLESLCALLARTACMEDDVVSKPSRRASNGQP